MIKGNTDTSLFDKVEQIKRKIGKELLSDNDLLILAFDEISKTYTHDETNYTK